MIYEKDYLQTHIFFKKHESGIKKTLHTSKLLEPIFFVHYY